MINWIKKLFSKDSSENYAVFVFENADGEKIDVTCFDPTDTVWEKAGKRFMVRAPGYNAPHSVYVRLNGESFLVPIFAREIPGGRIQPGTEIDVVLYDDGTASVGANVDTLAVTA